MWEATLSHLARSFIFNRLLLHGDVENMSIETHAER